MKHRKSILYLIGGGIFLVVALSVLAHFIIYNNFTTGSAIILGLIPLIYGLIWTDTYKYYELQVHGEKYKNIIIYFLPFGIILHFNLFVLTSLAAPLQDDAFIRFFVSPILTFILFTIWYLFNKQTTDRKKIVSIVYSILLLLYDGFLIFMMRFIGR
ncbi:hypothetical protein RJI07_06115 [Mycoplasmatota bacterium WC30]